MTNSLTRGPIIHARALHVSSTLAISGWGGDAVNPIYICEACGNEVEYGDQISVQMGTDNAVYFHKSCYIDPDNQRMIQSLVVAEDVMGI